jgi:hypothetical protein
MPRGAWKATGVALEVGKHSIPALVPQFGQRLPEMSLIIHRYIQVNQREGDLIRSNLGWMLLSRSRNNQQSSFEARTVFPGTRRTITPRTQHGLADIAIIRSCLPDSMMPAAICILTAAMGFTSPTTTWRSHGSKANFSSRSV